MHGAAGRRRKNRPVWNRSINFSLTREPVKRLVQYTYRALWLGGQKGRNSPYPGLKKVGRGQFLGLFGPKPASSGPENSGLDLFFGHFGLNRGFPV